jgi:hypothetical protein
MPDTRCGPRSRRERTKSLSTRTGSSAKCSFGGYPTILHDLYAYETPCSIIEAILLFSVRTCSARFMLAECGSQFFATRYNIACSAVTVWMEIRRMHWKESRRHMPLTFVFKNPISPRLRAAETILECHEAGDLVSGAVLFSALLSCSCNTIIDYRYI